jgi:hypothetical protein
MTICFEFRQLVRNTLIWSSRFASADLNALTSTCRDSYRPLTFFRLLSSFAARLFSAASARRASACAPSHYVRRVLLPSACENIIQNLGQSA